MNINKILLYDFFSKEKLILLLWFVSFIIFLVCQIGIFPKIFSEITTNLNNLNNSYILNFKKFNLVTYIFIIFLVLVLISFFEKIKKKIEGYIQPKYLLYLRKLLLKKILDKYSNDFKEIQNGDLVTRIINLTNGIWESIYLFMNTIFLRIISLVFISLYILFFNLSFGIYSVLFLICYLFIFNKTIKRGIKLSIIKEKTIIFLSAKLSDQFSNLLNIYINNEENTIIKETNKNLEKFQKNIRNEVNAYGNIFLISNFLLILYLITSFLIICYLHKTKKLNTANFISILIIIGFFVNNGYLINQDFYPVLLKITPLFANHDFLKFIFEKKKSGYLKNKITGNIEFKNIYFRYNQNQDYILNNFNLKIEPKSKMAIIGRSGSGKTTICKLLLNLYHIEKGDILIDNKSIKNYDTTFLRNSIIYVNQKTTLFNTTVIKNLQFGNNKDELYIINLLNKYNINIFDKLSNSVNSDSGVNGSNLSLGMQKIIFIMRGLLKESNMIIFDEPLAGLDKTTKKNVIHLIKNYCKHKTVIIVTHDKEIIPYVDKVIKF